MNICMIGAGYVGLVSAACLSDFGWNVTCVDKDETRVAELKRGIMPIYEPGLDDLVLRNAAAGRITFTTTRNGVAAKELQRQLGVTYKTAWRIGHELRKYMVFVDGDAQIGGRGRPMVEADKAFIGGKDKIGEDDKAIVLGMVERQGDVITRVVPDRRGRTILRVMHKWVREGARVSTDDGRSFIDRKSWGFKHQVINHAQREYVRGDVHTNTIESFWAALKRGINGTHIWVSAKHLQKYVWEFEFRHNLRTEPHLMFDLLLQAFPRP